MMVISWSRSPYVTYASHYGRVDGCVYVYKGLVFTLKGVDFYVKW